MNKGEQERVWWVCFLNSQLQFHFLYHILTQSDAAVQMQMAAAPLNNFHSKLNYIMRSARIENWLSIDRLQQQHRLKWGNIKRELDFPLNSYQNDTLYKTYKLKYGEENAVKKYCNWQV